MEATAARRRLLVAGLLALGLVVGVLPGPCRAQEPAPLPGPGPTALVLSGGSARGLAHVGVLEELEALGYDPRIVVGTSMGAVVGALYAAGYSPAEIRSQVLDIAWGEVFDPTAALTGPDRELRLPLATFSLDLARRRVSRGLFGDARINRALVALLFGANARAAGDFDRLARRYRAIAADLRTGEVVVLASGDLARAARASMSYPGFFAPVSWDGRVLVDGGIADNLPTAVARGLGAGTVIAVDAGVPEDEVSQEPLAVAGRALRLMQRNIVTDPLPPEVLILPQPGPVALGPIFPDDPEPIIEIGREAAAEALAGDAARAAAGGATAAGDGERPLPRPPERFDALRVDAPDSALARLARHVFSRVAPGPYDVAAVLGAVDRLYGTGLVDGVWPTVERAGTGDDQATLVVRVEAGPKLSLSGAAGFDNDRGGRVWAMLNRTTSVARRPVVLSVASSTDGLERWGALSARLLTSVSPAVAWSVGAHVRERSVRTFGDDTRATLEVLRSGGWAALELPYLLPGHFIALSGKAERLDPEDAAGTWSWGPLLRVAAVPAEAPVVGTASVLELEARWGDRPYHRVALAGDRTLLDRFVQAAALVDLRAVGGDAPPDALPTLGDDHAVPGLRWGEGRGRARAVAGIDVAVPAPMNGFARLRVRSGAVADRPADWPDARWVTGALVGGIWRTPLGVLEVGFGHATIGDGRFDVSVGRSF